MISKFRRLACVCLTGVMTVSLAASSALALTDANKNKNMISSETADLYDTVNFENVTGKIDLSGIALDNLANAQGQTDYRKTVSGKKTVIVSLDEKSVLESKSENETVEKYLSSFSGTMKIKSIKENQKAFFEKLDRSGISYTALSSYNTVMNGVAIELDVSDIEALTKLPQVQSVVFSETYAYPKSVLSEGNAQINPSNVYATGIYDSSDYYGYSDGSGMKIAVLDTGLDYTHPAFNNMPAVYDYTFDTISELMDMNEFTAVRSSAEKGVAITAEDVYINEKVPFAYDYADKDADVYPSYSQHGTHVAGIIAGKGGDEGYTDKDGNVPEDENGNPVKFVGVAPEAQLVICKIFTDDFDDPEIGGATTENIIAALEDCVNLQVDVINMSIGTTSGFGSVSINGDTEGEQLNKIYRQLKEQGISVIAAAGNEYSSGFGSAFGTNKASNPDSGTVGSPSTFDGALSVASINGQLSRYMSVTTTQNGAETSSPIYYLDSSNENAVQNDFCAQMLSEKVLGSFWQNGISSFKFKYVVIPGVGDASNYSRTIQEKLADKSEGPVIAVVKRGTNTFKDKVQIAQRMKADAIIVVNNVAGTIRMSLGDLKNPIPAVSVTMDAGTLLSKAAKSNVGYIEINTEYQAGPFMNDYSGWGATPDLKLKPEITSHGGEITSTVAGGYAEMSGTSMATPNLAGFVALVRSYLVKNDPSLKNDPVALTRLVNQLVMSTATTVYDQSGLAYSPRKQGAGLATLENVFNTNAYLYTEKAEDNRPKIELGDDKQKKGVYELEFFVRNTGTSALTFSTKSLFMTETLASNGVSVAEQAYMLNGSPVWTVGGESVKEGDDITVPAGQTKKIHVTLRLSASEKSYIEKSFENGMYVEGFLKLVSKTEGQCDLNIPFMGFYGDWDEAPMLDYNAFEITEFFKDASYTDETRPQPQVWATQAYGAYYNNKYYVPLGSFMYNQDENADQIYTEEEHIAVSKYSDFYGDESTRNYMTITSIKALYAGLLRNAELITYELYNADTGEALEIYDSETGLTKQRIYRTGKAYANGGGTVPALVNLEISPEELGLAANGKYKLVFHFYRQAEDLDDPAKQDNTFEMSFYVDYEAPVLVDSRIRYEDYKDNNKEKQRVYLDLDIFDNHYAQSVILCYAESDDKDSEGSTVLNLANEYITPIYNSVKNGINTVSLDITDIYEKYNSRLYVQLDDYALNHNVYQISFTSAKASSLPSAFEFADDDRITTNSNGEKEITIGVNEAYKLKLDYEGSANLSNFRWDTSLDPVVRVKNNEIFGVEEGDAVITVTGANNVRRRITVHVVDKGINLAMPSISFGVIKTASDGIQKAQGTVKVNAGQTFKLEIETDPWYYPVETLELIWASTDKTVADVDEYGNVTTFDKDGTTTISATIKRNGIPIAAQVMLNVQEPFTVSNMTLTKYHGSGGDIVIPSDKNITTIGEEAFKDNDNITSIVIPKTVTQISARAFKNCTALRFVYFICEGSPETHELASLATILRNAFEGCTSLEIFDISNCKTITLDKNVFLGCTSLKKVESMNKIGTMGDYAFKDCTSLKSADITGLHTAGEYVFENCTSLDDIQTAFYTQIGEGMFKGCTSLGSVIINNAYVANNAFEGCTTLQSVTFGAGLSAGTNISFRIGSWAFLGCSQLREVNLNGYSLVSIGDRAFENCSALTELEITNSDVILGESIFVGTNAKLKLPADFETAADGSVYKGTTLILAPKNLNGAFAFRAGTTEIGAYAFSDCTVSGLTELIIPDTVTKIGEGAFAHLDVNKVILHSGITEIPDYAFYDNAITEIVIPSSVTRIGTSAFQGAMTLERITFEDASSLEAIGDTAFLDCFSLTEVVLPDGAHTMGDMTFGNCRNLVSITLPSVTSLGKDTFAGCEKLETAVFGENASDAGEYTFFPGYITDKDGNLYKDEDGNFVLNATSLASVTLGNNMTKLGASVFDGCSKLVSIDLKNVKEIGAQAFAGCSVLETVTGLENVVKIGNAAFADCVKIPALNLASAVEIGDMAFYCSTVANYSQVLIPSVKTIGANAFFGGIEATVQLPAGLEYVGAGAFANSARLTSITVEAGNKNYFSEDGVLYRTFTNDLTGKTAYELIAYPSLKSADSYEIKEGTVTIAAFAFSYLRGTVNNVLLPYSVKTVGHAAFYSSNIKEYTFHSINAPTLIIEYYDIPMQAQDGVRVNYYALFYMNFNTDFIQFSGVPTTPSVSNVKINYPSNGVGYDNYIYNLYFGTKVLLAEMPLDDTRSLIEFIDGFYPVAEINAWNSLTVNDENKAMVESFAALVKEAHRIYNNISKSDIQLGYLDGKESELFAVEAALKPVKAKFNIITLVSRVYVSPDSTHRTEYKAGEKFDSTGLILIVEYDDFSTEIADMSLVTLADGYDRALTALDVEVQFKYNGKTIRVGITVSEDEGTDEGDNGGKLNPAVIYGPILGVVGAAAVAAAVVLILKKKGKLGAKAQKENSNDAQEETAQEEISDGANSAEDKSEDKNEHN